MSRQIQTGICTGPTTLTDRPAGLDFIEVGVGGFLAPREEEAVFRKEPR